IPPGAPPPVRPGAGVRPGHRPVRHPGHHRAGGPGLRAGHPRRPRPGGRARRRRRRRRGGRRHRPRPRLPRRPPGAAVPALGEDRRPPRLAEGHRRRPGRHPVRPAQAVARRGYGRGRPGWGRPGGGGAMTFAPYRGLRVVDLSDDLLAMAGSVLSGFGAEVILVEPPGGGPAREVAPMADRPDGGTGGAGGEAEDGLGGDLGDGPGDGPGGGMVSAHFLSTAAGKRSVTAAVDRPEGAALVRGLIARSDVLLCSADDDSLDRCGLGLAELMAANPRLIVASLTPFGRTGPLSRWRGSDLVAWAASGALTPIGDPDRRPL